MLTEKEKKRHRDYKKRNSDRYDYSWNKTHKEARKILEESDKDSNICYSCKQERKTRCHHVDGDGFNNNKDNLEWCCYSCDSKENALRYIKRV